MGGVIIIEPHDSWKDIFSELGPSTGINPSVLMSGFKNNEHDIQTGHITLLDFYRRLLKTLNRDDIEPEELLRRHIGLYNKVSGNYDTRLISLIQRLRKNFIVACFTNTETEIALLNKEKGLFNYFDRVFISTDMGLRKPNPESYKYVIHALGIKPAEAVFIDNNKDYVDAAEGVGLKGIFYKDVDQLIQDLANFSVSAN